MKFRFVLACLLAGITFPLIASDEITTRWNVTGHTSVYMLEGGGDAEGAEGAKLTIRGINGDPAGFGGAITSVDAKPYLGHTVTLSANLGTRDAMGGAALWLRVDAEGRAVAFTNSQQQPVKGNVSEASREISLDVPTEAERISFGTLLVGNGVMTVNTMRLQRATSDDSSQVQQEVLDTAISLVRTHGLRTREVDWASVEPRVRQTASTGKPVDVRRAIRDLLTALGDGHSRYLEPRSRQFMKGSGVPSFDPVVALRESGIGYLSVPTYKVTDIAAGQEFSAKVTGALAEKAGGARCGWIVDLRENSGGNMWPMISALKPFLGQVTAVRFEDASGTLRADGQDLWNSRSSLDLQDAPVAVLTGPATASSGEAVAVAFRGRANTQSFGSPTAGLSTANRAFDLPDGSAILLTTSVFVDRKGRRYGRQIEPDVRIVPGDEDATIAAAERWLLEQRGCLAH